MNSNILSHFHPDERGFAQKMVDWLERAITQHQLKRTDFLDPRQAHIVETLARRYPNLQMRLDGGYPQAERQRAIIAPDYMDIDTQDMGIRLLNIESGDTKIGDLDHGDYLGSMLGLGLKREKIGDLHVSERGCQCLVTEELADFIHLHLQQVHRVHVMTSIVSLDQLEPIIPKLQEMNLSVASMRLDGIVSDVCKLSRAKVMIPIKAGRCKVNWKVEEDPSRTLAEGDTISMKGFGRFVLTTVQGETKKGRIRLTIAKYV
ncbi:MAG: YlmH/Sll1252 family protein [Paenibacillaceae bacterium]